MDNVDNVDGLERLVVICVGLDQVIDGGAVDDGGSGVLQTRSRLYRAMTRAQLAVAVVNSALPGGWLEFLGRVEIDADGRFDEAMERRRGCRKGKVLAFFQTLETFKTRMHDSCTDCITNKIY